MQLTQDQKEMIASFLRTQDESSGDLRADKRVQVLSQINVRIREELFTLGVDEVSDEQVGNLLKRMKISVKPKQSSLPPVDEVPKEVPEEGTEPPEEKPGPEATEIEESEEKPKIVAGDDSVQENPREDNVATPQKDDSLTIEQPVWSREDVAEPKSDTTKSDSSSDEDSSKDEDPAEDDVVSAAEDDGDFGYRHWLGVCDDIATSSGQSVTKIRFAFILFGCLTGPIAITIYLFAYATNSQRRPNDFPTKDFLVVRIALLRVVGIAAGMFGVSWLFEFGAALAFLNYFGQIPDLNMWAWMTPYDGRILILVLSVLLPLAALSGLPLAYRWGDTIGMIVNAGLAIYAVVVSVGVASLMVGFAFGLLTHIAGYELQYNAPE